MSPKNSVLIFWDANVNGSNMLKSAVNSLEKYNIKLSKILYLVCEYIYENNELRDKDKTTSKKGKNAKERIEELKQYYNTSNISFIPLVIPSTELSEGKADEIKSVESMLIHFLFPEAVKLNPSELHLVLTSGTQSMRFAWISLYSKSILTRSFGENVNIWQQKADRGNKTDYLELYQVKIDKNPFIEAIENETFLSKKIPPIDLDSDGKIRRNSAIDVPMLILGERGTGKSTLIETIVVPIKLKNGYIKKKEIQTIVCGQLDSALAEDELFGHAKGSYTGAGKEDVNGKIKLANNGILFLDEIQDLPKSIQRKLLRALQDKKFRKIGSKTEEESDFRLVCASNNSLAELQEKLDPDFFDRIATFKSFIKPLREQDQSILENLWNNRWNYAFTKGFKIPEKPDSFSLVNKTLDSSKMKGNIRDMEQLIAYIARDVYQGTTVISEKVKKERYNKVLNEWLKDYNERYESLKKTGNTSFSADNVSQEHSIAEYMKNNSWKDINSAFKKWLADMAIENFGSRKEAAKALHCEEKTLYNAKV